MWLPVVANTRRQTHWPEAAADGLNIALLRSLARQPHLSCDFARIVTTPGDQREPLGGAAFHVLQPPTPLASRAWPLLAEDILDDVAVDISESHVAATEAERESFVVDTA